MNNNELEKIFGQQRTNECPLVPRERFTVTHENQLFIQQCRIAGYDISTIINLALSNLKPRLTPTGATWEGIDSVVNN
jgi:hypothetical protein